MPGRVAASIALMLVAVLLAGCGFHLQGSMTLPAGLRSVHVSAPDLLTPFAVELRQGIERNGATVATSAEGADAVIRIRADRTGRRVLSVSSRNTPQEFEIFYSVDYTIERGGKEVVPLQRRELTRSFSFDQSALLAKDREEALLREALARDLADLVLRRLATLDSVPAGPSPQPAGP